MLYPELFAFLIAALVISLGIIFYLKRSGDGPKPLTPSKTSRPDLEKVLEKTSRSWQNKLQGIFNSQKSINEGVISALEELLYTSDIGPKAAEFLLGELKVKLSKEGPLDSDSVKNILRENIQSLLVEHKVVQQKNMLSLEKEKTSTPQVILVVGVNGAGKTTSVGKLAHYFSTRGKSVLVVAADTFRAAAEKQLDTWAQRASVSYFTNPQTKDPAAVAFQGIEMAVKDKKDVIIVDTAGRLHNKEHLMEELKKVKRVIQKVISSAPHETLLVIDANNGQNAINQAKEFHSALGVTGLIVTKLDGSAKGGVVIGMAQEVGLIPVYVGLGEGIEDLEDFSPERFASALVGQTLAQSS